MWSPQGELFPREINKRDVGATQCGRPKAFIPLGTKTYPKTAFTTASAVMPKCLYSKSAGALAP